MVKLAVQLRSRLMFLAGLILAATAAAPPLSTDVGISAAVRAVVERHGKEFPPAAVKELEALQRAGDGTAAALLGELLLFTDLAGPRDWTKGCDYAEKAGRHGSALHNLATCHFLGQGRPRDMARARELYGQASELGFAKAACALGNMLIAGQGGDRDAGRGLELCKRAADTGEPNAQTDYGGYLLTNQHLPKDAVLARHYLAAAAAKRQRNAAFLLAQIYWNGDGVERDRATAAQWWAVAYEGGRVDAARHLGAEALSRVMTAVEAARPVPEAAIKDAEHWLGIAAEKDPDPAEREKAKVRLTGMRAIVAAAAKPTD
jgi:TPR repeat protein